MFTTSHWRTEPEPVFLHCSEVHQMPGRDEFVVQFKTKNGHYTSFVPKQHVDADNLRLQACIVADVDEGGDRAHTCRNPDIGAKTAGRGG